MRLITLLAWLVSSLGQSGNPLLLPAPAGPRYVTVSTGASALGAKPGATITLFVDVSPNAGIHVYAPGAQGYLPIALTLAAPKNVRLGKVVYPKSEIYLFAVLNESVPVYQKPFRLTQDVTIPASSKPGAVTLSGAVKYQACDDKECFAPASVPVTWSLTVN